LYGYPKGVHIEEDMLNIETEKKVFESFAPNKEFLHASYYSAKGNSPSVSKEDKNEFEKEFATELNKWVINYFQSYFEKNQKWVGFHIIENDDEVKQFVGIISALGFKTTEKAHYLLISVETKSDEFELMCGSVDSLENK